MIKAFIYSNNYRLMWFVRLTEVIEETGKLLTMIGMIQALVYNSSPPFNLLRSPKNVQRNDLACSSKVNKNLM